MLPSPTGYSAIDYAFSDAKHSGNIVIGILARSVQLAHLGDNFISQDGISHLFAMRPMCSYNSISMDKIFTSGTVLKVIEAIIGLVAILMVNLFSLWRRSSKSIHNYFVKCYILAYAMPAKFHHAVTVALDIDRHYSTSPKSGTFLPLVAYHAGDTSDYAHIGNFVLAFIANYISPFFFHLSLLKGAGPKLLRDCRCRTASLGPTYGNENRTFRIATSTGIL